MHNSVQSTILIYYHIKPAGEATTYLDKLWLHKKEVLYDYSSGCVC